MKKITKKHLDRIVKRQILIKKIKDFFRVFKINKELKTEVELIRNEYLKFKEDIRLNTKMLQTSMHASNMNDEDSQKIVDKYFIEEMGKQAMSYAHTVQLSSSEEPEVVKYSASLLVYDGRQKVKEKIDSMDNFK